MDNTKTMKKLLYVAAALLMTIGGIGCTASDRDSTETTDTPISKNDSLIYEYGALVGTYNIKGSIALKKGEKSSPELDSLRKKCRNMEFQIHKLRPELSDEQHKQYRKLQSTFFRMQDKLME